MKPKTDITVVMATYNGATFLDEQLASLIAQTHQNWGLLISDDGSTDGTIEIIEKFIADHPEKDVRLVLGPKKGFAQNFLTAMEHEFCSHRMVAFCDQDDVWMPKKLEHAVAKLAIYASLQPAVYGSLAQVVDEALKPIQGIQKAKIPFKFSHLLAANAITGNTLVLNPSAVELIRKAKVDAPIPYHDWWVLLLISGAGGHVVIDPTATILYRQHGQNEIGTASGLQKFRRNVSAITGRYQNDISLNTMALKLTKGILNQDSSTKVYLLSEVLSRRWWLGGIYKMLRAGIHRQSKLSTFAMCISLLWFNGTKKEIK
jgi:glycosyltransferase involved in cell wall biosynthesis